VLSAVVRPSYVVTQVLTVAITFTGAFAWCTISTTKAFFTTYRLPRPRLLMYSNSSSFLGGGNSARPGPLPYGQQPFSNQQQGQQGQQPNGFGLQPTGFSAAPTQSQYTGFPGQTQPQSFQASVQQPQYTGYPPTNQAQFQNQPPQQQSLQTGQQPQQQLPMRTGQTSSQIAQSFQNSSAGPPPPAKGPTSGVKIPKIRLSFLTAPDQAKFEQLFKSAVGDNQALDGMNALSACVETSRLTLLQETKYEIS
jgi:hypothetical protein